MTREYEWAKVLREVFPQKLHNAAAMTPTQSLAQSIRIFNTDRMGVDRIPTPKYPIPGREYSLIFVDNSHTRHPGRELVAGMAMLILGGVLLFSVPLKKLSGLGVYVDAGLLPKPSAVYRIMGSQTTFVMFHKGIEFSYTAWYEL